MLNFVMLVLNISTIGICYGQLNVGKIYRLGITQIDLGQKHVVNRVWNLASKIIVIC